MLLISFAGLIQNVTIEERVALLEIQVVEIEEDVTTLGVGLAGLGENVDFLFDEQVIQDERLFSLEQTTVDITAELVSVDNELEGEFFLEHDKVIHVYSSLCMSWNQNYS